VVRDIIARIKMPTLSQGSNKVVNGGCDKYVKPFAPMDNVGMAL